MCCTMIISTNEQRVLQQWHNSYSSWETLSHDGLSRTDPACGIPIKMYEWLSRSVAFLCFDR